MPCPDYFLISGLINLEIHLSKSQYLLYHIVWSETHTATILHLVMEKSKLPTALSIAQPINRKSLPFIQCLTVPDIFLHIVGTNLLKQIALYCLVLTPILYSTAMS